jgi:phosphatidylserine/phosphatidylglycerophosphate/cardiolipin synthase-like enzyme
MTSALGRAVARLIIEGDPDTVGTFVRALPRGVARSARELRARRPPSADAHTLALLDELVEAAGMDRTPPEQVAQMIESGATVRETLVRTSPPSTLVWTGPAIEGSVLRTTNEAVRDLVDGSQTQILVSTYSLRPEVRDRNQSLMGRLAVARLRGVGVTLVVHQNEDNRRALDTTWPTESPRPRLLTWPIPEGDEMVKLHAKIVEADDEALLVTSANLTYHGLFANLELGILVRGSVAGEVRRHFDRLERQGHLKEWA